MRKNKKNNHSDKHKLLAFQSYHVNQMHLAHMILRRVDEGHLSSNEGLKYYIEHSLTSQLN